jgi:hypothetical protein
MIYLYNLKEIINENNEIKNKKINLTELIKSDEYNNIAYNLRKIKSLKYNIKEFLITNGIWGETMDL